MLVPHARRSLLPAALLLLAALVLLSLFFLWRMKQTLSTTAVEVQHAREFPYTLRPLVMPLNSGFAPVLSRADLASGASLGDQLFLAGTGDLLVYSRSGVLIRSYAAGIDLPGAPIVMLATGKPHGASAPQLVIATAGAGVLLLQPSSGAVQQLLPSAPELRNITAAAVLPDGDVLLGTRRHGVLRFDGEALTLFRPEYRNLAITAIAAGNGAVWVGTQADGLLLTQGGLTRHFQAKLPDPHIQALAMMGNQLFAATPNGVAQFVDGQTLRTLAPGSFARALTATDRDLTLALFDGGTLTLPLGPTHNHIAAPLQTDDRETRQFLTLADGTYALQADGLFRRQGASWVPALTLPTPTLTDNNVAALAFAPDDRLWIGYFDHGLDVLSPDASAVRHLESDQLFCINRIAVDPIRQTMAVATANGLVLFDHGGVPRQTLGTRDGLISEHVTDIAWSPQASGSTMALATPAGLTLIDKGGVESLYAFQGLVNNHVYSVAFSPEGNLLAGTLGGVSELEHGAVRRNLTTGNSRLSHNWISAVLPLPAFAGGGTLLGTYGGGLLQLTAAGQVIPMPGAPRDAVINPNALLVTSTHVFAGSLGQGLWCYGRSSGRWQAVTAGLPSQSVTALAAHAGELFIGTDNGLVHIPEARLPA